MRKTNFILIFFVSLSLAFIACSSSDDKIVDDPTDNEKPVITCVDDIFVTIDASENFAIVTYDAPVATDNVSVTVKQTAGLPSSSEFPVGITTNTFVAKDPSGNMATCSFDVIVKRDAPSASKPYFLGHNPTPNGKTWKTVAELSDEFEGAEVDNKWVIDPAKNAELIWPGRPPALFQKENFKVDNGELIIEVGKLSEPITITPYGKPVTYTYYGGRLCSKATSSVGHYYECRMKMNKTEMGGGFWLANQATDECNSKHEIDITESVGHLTAETHSWAKDWDRIFHSNAIRREDKCSSDQERDQKGKVLPVKNSDKYYVYGFWWKSATELLFYIDGEYAYTLTPPVPFDRQLYLQFSIEAYDWNPIPADGGKVANASLEERQTHLDYIRTFKLVDKTD